MLFPRTLFNLRRCYTRYPVESLRVPFEYGEDTNGDATAGDKYEEVNNMYAKMFTGETVVGNTGEEQVPTELEQLNKEAYDIFTVPVLNPDELAAKAKSNERFILRSMSTDPHFNLALEDYVFSHTPLPKNGLHFKSERLLLYANDKCVVIGKNQNPWKEVFLSNVHQRQYQFIRRKSGGGAVVHDLGNINYSFLTSRERFNRLLFNEHIVNWLKPHNSSIALNERGDITLAGKKISGSAFKISKGKGYHHGTMLISAQLPSFSGLLKPAELPGIKWECNSVRSVRSDVDNLSGKGVDTVEDFCEIVANGFCSMVQEDVPVYYCDESSITTELKDIVNELKSFKWKYLTMPKFTVHLGDLKVRVEKGIIVESDIPSTTGLIFYDFVNSLNRNSYSNYTGYKL